MDCSLPGSSVHTNSPGKNYWSELPFPSPEDLSDPRIEPRSPTLQANSLPSEPPGKPFICNSNVYINLNYAIQNVNTKYRKLNDFLCFQIISFKKYIRYQNLGML